MTSSKMGTNKKFEINNIQIPKLLDTRKREASEQILKFKLQKDQTNGGRKCCFPNNGDSQHLKVDRLEGERDPLDEMLGGTHKS